MQPILLSLSAILFLLLQPPAAGGERQALGGTGTSLDQSSTLFLSLPPETLLVTKPHRPRKFIEPVKRRPGRYPNWANLREETVAQGGFQPASSQSDSAGGMRVGISFMKAHHPGRVNPKWKPLRDSARVYCWIRMTEWKWHRAKGVGGEIIPLTLRSQGIIFHTGPARGLDSTGLPGDTGRVRLIHERKKLEPIRSSNRLFPELVALKLNIAMSELGKTPAGFGDLIFDQDGSVFDELTIRGIAAKADTMMTRWEQFVPADFETLWTVVHAINRAFAGPLDTLTWLAADSLHPRGNLAVRGQVDVASVPFLRLPVPFVPTRIAPTCDDEESDPVFGEKEISDESDENGTVPTAVALLQNYPNPFNPATTIGFRLVAASRVTVRVIDILGREVALLARDEVMDEGSQVLEFNAGGLSSGVYLYQVTAEALELPGVRISEAGKMLLQK